MPGDLEIESLVVELKKMKAMGAFKTFIDYIVFPRYRNIEPDTRITFDFPLTVLVGQNGSGKTAVLQALYGAPGGTSVSRWWFETAVDPIIEPAGTARQRRRSADLPSDRRSAFWYGYRQGEEERYVIKTRIRRANDPDNWEPSRPIAGYGMKTLPGDKRYDLIRMDSAYVNFKLIINAFDKCFYFVSKTTLTEFGKSSTWRKSFTGSSKPRAPRVQDYLRFKSRRLKRVLDEDIVLMHAGQHPLNEKVRTLSDEEIARINAIIGKSYTGGKVVTHRFFEAWGTTVAFSTAERNYTDAFAGSGEGAVVRLVLEIEDATEGSLILLDEPETSLHPGAQERMLAYLLDRIKRKRLQVVISTHSPTLVQYLPREAIKVFSFNAQGNADIVPDRPAEEAFHYIGHRYDAGINIVVEDRLAKAVVDAAIQSKGPAFAKRFSVSFGPGGQSAIKKDMVVYSRSGNGPVILFDGDLRPEGNPPHVDTDEILAGEFTAEHLKKLIDRQAGSQIDFAMDSGMPDESKLEMFRRYLDYYRDKVHYLPFPTPEQAIWDDNACLKLLEVYDPGEAQAKAASIIIISDYKKRFATLSEVTKSVDAVHNLFVGRFQHTNNDFWNQLVALVSQIGDSHV